MAAIDVDKLNLKELVNLEAKVQSAIVEARSRERAELKRKMADLAENSRLFGDRIVGNGRGVKKPLGLAKYANPENKADTSTGRGRKPNWLVGRLKKGAKLSDFEI